MQTVKQQHVAIFSSNFQTMRQIYARYSSADVKERGGGKAQALKVLKTYPSHEH